MKIRVVLLWVLVALLLWPGGAVLAQDPVSGSDPSRFFVDEDVSLDPGETFEGSLGIVNGDLDLPDGSVVQGDVFVTNGQAIVNGRVEGNLAVIGGHLDMGETAWVRGDLFVAGGSHDVAGHVVGNLSILFGSLSLRSTALVEGDLLVAPGQIDREQGAQVRGKEVHDLSLPTLPFMSRQGAPELDAPALPDDVEAPSSPPVLPSTPSGDPFARRVSDLLGRLLWTLFLGGAFLAIGALIAALWPRQTQRVAGCIAAAPLQSLGLGLLTFLIAVGLEIAAVVAMILIILLAALLIGTVVLIPLGVLLILLSWLILLPVPLALAGGMVLGWVGLAAQLGRLVLRLFRVGRSTPLGNTLLGLLITVPVAAILWIAKPVCCAWPFIILLTSVGLGAVFHTRFGRQECGSGRGQHPAVALVDESEPLPSEAMALDDGRPEPGPATGP